MINKNSNLKSLSHAEKRAWGQQRRNNQASIYPAISTIPVKATVIAKVLLTKWPTCLCPSPRGILCLLESRIPNNGLVVKNNHISTQEFSKVQTVSPLSSTWFKTYCVFRVVLVTAVVPKAHQMGLEMSPWGLHLGSHLPLQTHLQGWMMSWVPLPKVSTLVPPPVFTPWDNPLHKSLCQGLRPWTFQNHYINS